MAPLTPSQTLAWNLKNNMLAPDIHVLLCSTVTWENRRVQHLSVSVCAEQIWTLHQLHLFWDFTGFSYTHHNNNKKLPLSCSSPPNLHNPHYAFLLLGYKMTNVCFSTKSHFLFGPKALSRKMQSVFFFFGGGGIWYWFSYCLYLNKVPTNHCKTPCWS